MQACARERPGESLAFTPDVKGLQVKDSMASPHGKCGRGQGAPGFELSVNPALKVTTEKQIQN